jgi:hypothetical protein
LRSAITIDGGNFRHSVRERKSRLRLKAALVFAWRHRGDVAVFAMAAGAAGAILVNALFLQSARHPAPWFGVAAEPKAAMTAVSDAANPLPRPRPSTADAKAPEAGKAVAKAITAARPLPAAKPAMQPALSQRETVSRDDPIAERIAATRRVVAVQRALSEFGYGQIRATGIAGPETQAAIEKFERERMMPVTGKISARMLRELSAITGRSFD